MPTLEVGEGYTVLINWVVGVEDLVGVWVGFGTDVPGVGLTLDVGEGETSGPGYACVTSSPWPAIGPGYRELAVAVVVGVGGPTVGVGLTSAIDATSVVGSGVGLYSAGLVAVAVGDTSSLVGVAFCSVGLRVGDKTGCGYG